MNYVEFAHLASRNTYIEPSNDAPSTVREFSSDASTVSDLHAELLDEFLTTGDVNPAAHTSARRAIIDFVHTHQKSLDDDAFMEALLSDEDVFAQFSSSMLLSVTTELWGAGLRRDSSIPRTLARRVQIAAALENYTNVARFHEMESNGILYEDRERDDGRRISVMNALGLHAMALANENDQLIALMQAFTAQNPHTIVLPAPGKYEHGSKRENNSDFIVIDTVKKQVHGVQSKLAQEQAGRKPYNPEAITVVSGVHDLMNSRAIRVRKDKSDLRVVPWPGISTAHFAGTVKAQELIHMATGQKVGKTVPTQVLKSSGVHAMMYLHQGIRSFTHGTRDRNKEIAQNLAAKITSDMSS